MRGNLPRFHRSFTTSLRRQLLMASMAHWRRVARGGRRGESDRDDVSIPCNPCKACMFAVPPTFVQILPAFSTLSRDSAAADSGPRIAESGSPAMSPEILSGGSHDESTQSGWWPAGGQRQGGQQVANKVASVTIKTSPVSTARQRQGGQTGGGQTDRKCSSSIESGPPGRTGFGGVESKTCCCPHLPPRAGPFTNDKPLVTVRSQTRDMVLQSAKGWGRESAARRSPKFSA
jgi:hypothetical protein